ncbi:DUF2924 domain-containing protein [Nitratireductor mangrovi]|uniref:DUF2924 domain-containing protein n=1 Tax=Nitratireductor mangrovi TaxID=2599600 RepID=A0A6H0E004_9HYPH|nr:DUF2924 domain-containing protein [Nitratireductor mangrovi]QIS94704.1 DUF2924 domain-containing protein [Nitratireductor mangrovi]
MLPEETLEREVAAIGALTRAELTARWQKAYGCLPPKGMNRSLLERAAAWHVQAGRLGGLSSAAQATLRAGQRGGRQGLRDRSQQADASAQDRGRGHGVGSAAGGAPDPEGHRPSAQARVTPPPAVGTRLMREWNGRMHVVDVTEQGILFDGKIYRSLSSVAKRITGAHWSGPRFFGL